MSLDENERAFSAWLSAQLEILGLDVDVYLDYVCDTLREADEEHQAAVGAGAAAVATAAGAALRQDALEPLLELLDASLDEPALKERLATEFAAGLLLSYEPVRAARRALAVAQQQEKQQQQQQQQQRRRQAALAAQAAVTAGSPAVAAGAFGAVGAGAAAAAVGTAEAELARQAVLARFAFEAEAGPAKGGQASAGARRRAHAQRAAPPPKAKPVEQPSRAPEKTGDRRRLKDEAQLRAMCAGAYTSRQTRADRHDDH